MYAPVSRFLFTPLNVEKSKKAENKSFYLWHFSPDSRPFSANTHTHTHIYVVTKEFYYIFLPALMKLWQANLLLANSIKSQNSSKILDNTFSHIPFPKNFIHFLLSISNFLKFFHIIFLLLLFLVTYKQHIYFLLPFLIILCITYCLTVFLITLPCSPPLRISLYFLPRLSDASVPWTPLKKKLLNHLI